MLYGLDRATPLAHRLKGLESARLLFITRALNLLILAKLTGDGGERATLLKLTRMCGGLGIFENSSAFYS
jgi:hypothetical protein